MNQKIDEVQYNGQTVFTEWSVKLLEAISTGNADEQGMLTKNKLLGFQKFDFNVMNAPFRLTFTDSSIPISPRQYDPLNAHLLIINHF